MTPFGLRIRQLRREKQVTQKQMAEAIGVSAAYVSALENGKRGAPTWDYLQRVIQFFNVIWDDAEELQELAGSSHPKVTIDTSNLSVEATELANFLAANLHRLSREDIAEILHNAKTRTNRNR